MAFALLPFLAIWMLVAGFKAWRQPGLRLIFGIKVGLWVLTACAILLAHLYYYRTARSVADKAVTAVLRYKADHGQYPEKLEDSVARTDDFKKWRILYARGAEGAPRLVYWATFIVYDTYRYDFERNEWEYQPD